MISIIIHYRYRHGCCSRPANQPQSKTSLSIYYYHPQHTRTTCITCIDTSVIVLHFSNDCHQKHTKSTTIITITHTVSPPHFQLMPIDQGTREHIFLSPIQHSHLQRGPIAASRTIGRFPSGSGHTNCHYSSSRSSGHDLTTTTGHQQQQQSSTAKLLTNYSKTNNNNNNIKTVCCHLSPYEGWRNKLSVCRWWKTKTRYWWRRWW